MLALMLATVAVTASFEGGSIGRVEQVAPNQLRCAVKGQSDQNHRNRQANWYYFRLDGLPKGEFQIDFVDLIGEYNFRAGTRSVTAHSRPVYSYDNRTWTHFRDEEAGWDEKDVRLIIRFRPERPTMWIAHMVPYTERNLDALLALRHPALRHESIGKSLHGRDLALLTITDPAVPESGKKVVWLMARQHAWETGTSFVADGSVRFLLSNAPEAAALRRATIFKIQPIFDSDGVAEGAVRFNANGYDNNRNWDTVDPKLMPEIAATKSAIWSWMDAGHRLDLFLALHNTESTDYVEGPVAQYKDLANDLVDRLRATTSFYDPRSPRDSMGTRPIDKGRMTVDQDLFSERRLPAFLMELMVERHPKLGHPRTSEDYREFGQALVKCLAGAARGGR